MIVDWLGVTLDGQYPAVLEPLLNNLPGPWRSHGYALGRYTRTRCCGGISVLSDAPGDDGVHIIVTGQGCRELEKAKIVRTWPNCIGGLLRAKARFARLDVTIDDRDGLLDMDTIIRCCTDALVVSRYRRFTPREPLCPVTGVVMGRMVEFGTRGSDTFVRIYDKALKEQVTGPWMRVELEARRERAQALAVAIARDGGGGRARHPAGLPGL